MTKIRKQKRKKKFQFHVSRKRMNKKKISGSIGEINEIIAFSPTQKNFYKNGLTFDVNKDIKTSNGSNSREAGILNKDAKNFLTETVSKLEEIASQDEKKQSHISEDQVEYLEYLVNKHGNNFKDMAKDRRNYLQYTWKQLRQKIKSCKIIFTQYKRISKIDSKSVKAQDNLSSPSF